VKQPRRYNSDDGFNCCASDMSCSPESPPRKKRVSVDNDANKHKSAVYDDANANDLHSVAGTNDDVTGGAFEFVQNQPSMYDENDGVNYSASECGSSNHNNVSPADDIAIEERELEHVRNEVSPSTKGNTYDLQYQAEYYASDGTNVHSSADAGNSLVDQSKVKQNLISKTFEKSRKPVTSGKSTNTATVSSKILVSRQVDKRNGATSALNPVKARKGALKASGMSSKTATVLRKIRAHQKQREKRTMTEEPASPHNPAPVRRTPIPVLSSKTRLLVSETASPNSVHQTPSVAPAYQKPSLVPFKQTPAVPMYKSRH